ncbi:hypothetical protein Pfo_013934 [Paulownia fortunei]|nr:hypothetical protein Pfo_013934 [Paulownia fortunei]
MNQILLVVSYACKSGILMQPNAANMCAKCQLSEVDITEDLQKHANITHCPECDSYLQPMGTWITAQLESTELLTFCVKNQVEQAFTVEYVVQEKMCESCSRVQANPHQWVAAVQLRQHLIVKHDAAKYAIRIKQMDQGVDFFFNNRSHGVKFVEFLGKVALQSGEVMTNNLCLMIQRAIMTNKYTFSVEISPICHEDLICLPPKVSVSLGNLGPLVICNKVSNIIALLDTLRQSFLDAKQYWRSSFKALLSSRQLVECIVLDVEAVSSEFNVGGSRYVLADAQVARVSDFGKKDTIFSVRTHLGHLLTPWDYALGYDSYGANSNDIELEKYNGLFLPNVILIKKSFEEKHLEENPDSIFNLSLYPNKEIQPSEMASMTAGEDVSASMMTEGEDVSSTLADEFQDLDLGDEESHDDRMKE